MIALKQTYLTICKTGSLICMCEEALDSQVYEKVHELGSHKSRYEF